MTDEHCQHCGGVVARSDKVCPHCQRGLTGKALLSAAAAQATPEGNATGVTLLVLMALGASGIGLLFLSNATIGVGLMCGGCLLGVLARLVQAAGQQTQLLHLRQVWSARDLEVTELRAEIERLNIEVAGLLSRRL